MALQSPLHTFLHLVCLLPSAKALHTLIFFAWIAALTNILYAREAHAEKTPVGNHWCDGTYI